MTDSNKKITLNKLGMCIFPKTETDILVCPDKFYGILSINGNEYEICLERICKLLNDNDTKEKNGSLRIAFEWKDYSEYECHLNIPVTINPNTEITIILKKILIVTDRNQLDKTEWSINLINSKFSDNIEFTGNRNDRIIMTLSGK
jgi:hypothetical protein